MAAKANVSPRDFMNVFNRRATVVLTFGTNFLKEIFTLDCRQELHASPHIEHTPHIVLSIYIHIWNVLSIYGYVGYHEVLTRLSNQAGKITLVPVNFPGAKPIMKLVSLNDVSLQRTREKRKG